MAGIKGTVHSLAGIESIGHALTGMEGTVQVYMRWLAGRHEETGYALIDYKGTGLALIEIE